MAPPECAKPSAGPTTPRDIAAASGSSPGGAGGVSRARAVQRIGDVPEPAGADVLTRREREVVTLIAEGLTNAELAARLYISPKTAAVHVSNVLAKLHMASRTEVATWAIREGIAP